MTDTRTLLITGAAGGIGQATVLHFANQGWRVIGVDRAEFPSDFPQDGHFIQNDIADPANYEAIFQQVADFTDDLHALVNNAAVQIAKPLLETSLEDWEEVMNVNVRAAFLMTQEAYPLLKPAQGAVVNVSSVHAVATSADIATYAASKGAMMALTRAMAIEFAPDNVRANAILPGAVDTGMLRDGLSRDHVSGGSVEERLDDLASKTVIQRVGTPEEIAAAIYFLADNEQSSFMTGQPLIVDGGATTRLSTE
ncbi:MAG: SDR family NAD(P)-dependent oxidoreductase [Chloroflexi bacterium]|nr:MAG: SDR family NAD(P)-dependent oxidoreductase [Chloroflexota bacterium]MBL1194308.1 SDR family oxidoreductase [Chloroflexota bacterium]NOH11598.1 SDR family oxidoreductase [Chloroflexota bacterium]